MKFYFAIFVGFSLIFAVGCAGQFYCSNGSNKGLFYLRFGIHRLALNSQGCFTASYVKSTCDISFHESEATIASIPLRSRRKRQTYLGGSLRSIFKSLFTGTDESGLVVPFNINQYVDSLPKNSVLYAVMTDSKAAAYYGGYPFCENNLINPLWRHHAYLGGREDIWYYQRRDGTRSIIAFNKECPYTCLMH